MGRNYCVEGEEAVKDSGTNLKLEAEMKGEHLSNLENSEVYGTKIKNFISMLSRVRRRKKYNFIPNDELEPILKKTFGKDADKARWLMHISSALERRDDLKDLFDEFAGMLILQYSNRSDPESENYILRIKEDGGLVPDLEKLPVGLLSQIGGMLASMMQVKDDGDLHITTGWIGNLQLEFITPMRLAQMTADLPFYKFIKRLTYYNQNVEQQTRRFTRKRPERRISSKEESRYPGKRILFNRKDYGLVELMNTAAGHLMQQPLADLFGDKEDLLELTAMLLRGQAYFDENGKVWVYEREAKVKGKYYPGTKDPIYSFFDKVPYMMNEDRQWVGFEKPILGDKQLVFDAKKVTKQNRGPGNWYGMNQLEIYLNYAQSIQEILDESGVNFVAEYNTIVDQRDELRTAIKNLPKDKQKDVAKYLTMLDNEFVQIHGLTEFQLINTKKKSYFPRLYTAGKRIIAIRAAQEEWTKRVEDASTLFEAEEDSAKKIERFGDLIESNRNLLLLNQKLEILSDPNILRDTTQSDNPIFADNYAKHFREITHLIPINVARTDEFVIQDYISENISSIERMKVVLELAELAISNVKKPRTMKYAINLFKRTFGFPDAEGSIFGMRFQDDSMGRMLSRIGITTDPNAANRAFRTLNSVNVGNLLSNPLDGVQNFSSVLQDILNSGREEFNIASQMLRKNRDYWMEKAENAGITVYIKYLEGFLDKAFRASELEDYKGAKKHILKAIKNIENQPRDSSRRELKRLYKNDLKVLKREFPSIVNRVARQVGNYAIQRRVEVRKAEGRVKGAAKLILNAYGIMPSIEQTETDLRVTSYIIAHNKIKKLLKGQKMSTSRVDELARNYVFFTQFGLEAQHVGDMFGTTLGKWWGSLGVWRNQKFGWSLDTQRQLIRSYFKPGVLFDQDEEGRLLKPKDRSKLRKSGMKAWAASRAYADAIIALFHLPWHGATYSKRAEAYRRLAPAVRKGQAHLMLHGLATSFFTFAVFINPAWISLPFLLTARRAVQTKGAHKFGYGLNDPLYALIFASGALVHNIATGDEEDWEDKNLFLGSRVMRNLVGVGGTDTVLTLLAINRAYEAYISGETPDDSYWQNPAAQHSFSGGLYGESLGAARKGAEEVSSVFGDWSYDKEMQKRAGKISRYYKYMRR
jgi:hypothetical protein